VLAVILLVGRYVGQGIPVFEPLSSTEGIAVQIDERPLQG